MASIGKEAPGFTLSDEKGNNVQLSNLKGQKVVLFFYPKDDTPGCTREAIDFTNKKNAMPVVRTSSIEYNSAMFLDEEYTTVIRCSKVGKTSFDLDYEVHSVLGIKVKGQTKIVMADLVAGKSVPLDNRFRKLFITRDLALDK